MKRTLYTALTAWKERNDRKPLILRGTRQTGKTYLLTEFGNREFRKLHYLNFQKDRTLNQLFEGNLSPGHLLELIEFALKDDVNIGEDLLFFDEIQDCPRALTSLKYFCEDMPQLAVVSAGSLLGVVGAASSFPVGKVNFLDLYPMSFVEFLEAMGESRSVKVLEEASLGTKIPPFIHDTIMGILKEYMVVGGMPEIVALYRTGRASKRQVYVEVRERQQELLSTYLGDFSKYAGTARAKELVAVFESIPSQLAKENKRYIASQVVEGGRFSQLQDAIDWLTGAGLVRKVMITNSGVLPFSSFTKPNRFKLYFFDIGMLGALGGLDPEEIILQHDLFATFKGAFCENLVAQEFTYAGGKPLYAWASNTAEVEFIRNIQGNVLPIEVKAGLSGKLKSLNVFVGKYQSSYQVRISSRNLEINASAAMHSYPLYLAYRFPLDETAS